MRNDFLPVLSFGFLYRRRQETEVLRVIIGANNEPIMKMIDMIFMLALARQKYFEFAARIVGVEIAVLLADGLRRNDHQKSLRLCFEDIHDERFVVFLVDQLIHRRIGSDHVPVNLMLAQRRSVLLGVK